MPAQPRLVVKPERDSEVTLFTARTTGRTLLKSGHAEVLQLFGYPSPEHINLKRFTVADTVTLGRDLSFSFSLDAGQKPLGKIRLEYGIDFLLKNGKHGRKIFKISELTTEASARLYTKSHSFKLITTRKYYVGIHRLSVIVNGVVMGTKRFKLRNK